MRPTRRRRKASATEPPEIRQLRLQVHQYGDPIAAGTRDQKRLQQEIGSLRDAYRLVRRWKSSTSELDAGLRQRAEELPGSAGEKEHSRSDRQDEQAGAGRADGSAESREPAGLAELSRIACFLPAAGWARDWRWDWAGVWLELRDKSIRTEADAEAALELPLLVAVPWVGAEAHGKRKRQIQVLEPEQESGRAQRRES